MLSNEIKEQFILLRAENKSYSQIIKELHISKSSCIKLSKKLNSDIAQAKADRLQALYNAYFMTKEARIQHLGETLLKIDRALDKADLSSLSPKDLLDYKLKYSQALKEEYIPVVMDQPIEDNEEGYTEILKALLARSRTAIDLGGLSTTELSKELLLIEKIHKAEKETASPENSPTENNKSYQEQVKEFYDLMGWDKENLNEIYKEDK
jgi:hypothetical protein